MDYKKKIKEERGQIDKIINNPELEGLAIFSLFEKNHMSNYTCIDAMAFGQILFEVALGHRGMELALRTAVMAIDDYKKEYTNGSNNPSLN